MVKKNSDVVNKPLCHQSSSSSIPIESRFFFGSFGSEMIRFAKRNSICNWFGNDSIHKTKLDLQLIRKWFDSQKENRFGVYSEYRFAFNSELIGFTQKKNRSISIWCSSVVWFGVDRFGVDRFGVELQSKIFLTLYALCSTGIDLDVFLNKFKPKCLVDCCINKWDKWEHLTRSSSFFRNCKIPSGHLS